MGYKLFISHAEADEKIAKKLVDDLLIGSLDIKQKEIFCTSIEGLGIDSGDKWKSKIRSSLLNSNIVLCLMTPNYKSSEMCLLEMGAAWVSDCVVIPVVAEPCTFSNLGPIYVDTQAIKLSQTTGLDNMRDKIIDILGIDIKSLATSRWTDKKRDFRNWLKKFLEDNPFSPPISKDTINVLSNKCSGYKLEVEELTAKNNELEEVSRKQREYISELESAKDKVEVKKIKRKRGMSTDDLWEEFEELAGSVKAVIDEFEQPIRTKIFSDYSGNDLQIPQYDYSSLYDARANGILDSDGNVNQSSKQIKRAYKELKALSEFMSQDITKSFEEFVEEFDEKYSSAEFDIDNKLFWEQVLKIKMSYET